MDTFRKLIYDHYHTHGRCLPWRQTADAYSIFVSEIMLQQTPVERVLGKYEGFIRAFPDFPSLAAASLDRVLREWQGLGYNRRALALTKAAELISGEFGGRLPPSVDLLAKLPGIGRTTASAVAAFAFGIPVVFIETNIRTVFIHFFFPERERVSDRQIMPLLESALDRTDPRTWYHALMDYGAMLKRTGERAHRKSTGYHRQSPFPGSDRRVRGAILRILLERKGLSEAALVRALGEPEERVRRILADLEKEGFLRVSGGALAITR
jgi:A/G-specific adenine glycosylase